MMARLLSLLSVLMFLPAGYAGAQEPVLVNDTVPEPVFEPYNVFETLTEKDSVTSAVVNIYQDKRIEQLFLDRQTLSNTGVIAGFRVQVFSSNRQQTAKTEAFRIKALVKERFPEKGVYESYSSPFWKVRVGDFRTREDAQELLTELMSAFPDMKREMYIVADDIVVAGSK